MLNPDGTQTQDGQAPASSTDGAGTSQETSITPAMQTLIDKAVNDRLAKAGRDHKALTDRENAIRTLRDEALTALEASNRAAEQREAEALASASAEERPILLREQAARRAIADANRIKLEAEKTVQENADAIAEGKKARWEKSVRQIAKDKGVDPEQLLALSDPADDAARIERFAAALPKAGQPKPNTPRGDGGGPGGTVNQSLQQLMAKPIRGMNQKQLAEHKAAIKAAQSG